MEKNASVWYGAVLRGDFGRIIVREGANIQDNTVVHVNDGVCEIGRNATIGHSCIVHDCTIGEQALVGNGSIVLDKAVVGARSLIAAGATVTPNTRVPDETIAKGSPAKDFTPLTATAKGWVDHNAEVYRALARAGTPRASNGCEASSRKVAETPKGGPRRCRRGPPSHVFHVSVCGT